LAPPREKQALKDGVGMIALKDLSSQAERKENRHIPAKPSRYTGKEQSRRKTEDPGNGRKKEKSRQVQVANLDAGLGGGHLKRGESKEYFQL